MEPPSSLVSNKSPIKSGLLICLLLLASFLLSRALLSGHRESSKQKSGALVEAYRAEMLMRMADAVTAMPQLFSANENVNQNKISKSTDSLAAQALKIMDRASLEEPNDPTILVKKIILKAHLGQDIAPDLIGLSKLCSNSASERLSQSAKNLAFLAQSLYSTELKIRQNCVLSANAANIIEDGLSAGWFRDEVLLAVYKHNHETDLQRLLQSDMQAKTWQYVSKIAFVSIAGVLAAGVGVLVILYQLFIRKKENYTKSDLLDISNNVVSKKFFPQTDWQTAALIFGAWFFTQILVAFVVNWLKQNGISLGYSQDRSLPSAISIAIIYLLSNGPAVLFIYFLVLKPNHLHIADGLGFSLKNTSGKLALISTGVLAWCAALPLVTVAYIIAATFLNSAGSSNPIIAIVMEAAQAHDFVAIVLFYITLGVLAPLCEETLFRGFLYRYLQGRSSVIIANILSSALFALAHVDAGAALPLFCLGSVFALVFERSNNIIPAMIAHGLWNSVTFTLILLLFGG